MKPILFAANANTFTTNGKGTLEPITCNVTEQLNGEYELECTLPVDSPHYSDIANNMILVVTPSDGETKQPFRIYQITEPLNGVVTLMARHITYDLSYNTTMPFTAGSVTDALQGLKNHAVETCPFTFWTDKSAVASFKVEVPCATRSRLGGVEGSILDVYGGEYKWDGYTVRLYNQRGSDTDVTLRYGKNITDISQEQNLENVITGIVPYWADGQGDILTLPEVSIDSSYASSYPFKRTVPVDFSSEWNDKPTAVQLRARANSYITANKVGIPRVSIKVSFVALWQTEEYKDIAPLERVHLGDTVGVVFEKYGIDTRAEVVKTVWDCLAEKYLSIELGEVRSNLASAIVDIGNETAVEIVEAKSDLQKAIDAATAAINGADGGYIKINASEDGKPYEILIMDNEDAAQAHTVWKYNLGGWGVSQNGINGPFNMAATLNSTYGASINADYVITGTMSANRVRTGLIESTAKRTGTQIPVSQWNLDSGQFKTADGEFSGSITGTTITGSTITSKDSENNPTKVTTISGGNITTNNLTATGGSITSSDGGSPAKTTTITGGKITTNNLDATGGSITGTTISGSTITSVNSGNTKSTTISGGDITTNALTASGGTVTGSTIQTASSGRRIKMDTTTSVKGMNGDTIDNLINLGQSVSGTNQMTIDARNQLNIRTPNLYVTNVSAQEGTATVYQTYTNNSADGFNFINAVSKNMSPDPPYDCREIYVKGVRGEQGESYDVLCTLPVFLNVTKTNFKIIHGMLLSGQTTTSVVI